MLAIIIFKDDSNDDDDDDDKNNDDNDDIEMTMIMMMMIMMLIRNPHQRIYRAFPKWSLLENLWPPKNYNYQISFKSN